MAWTRNLTAIKAVTCRNGQFSVTGTVEVKEDTVSHGIKDITVSGLLSSAQIPERREQVRDLFRDEMLEYQKGLQESALLATQLAIIVGQL